MTPPQDLLAEAVTRFHTLVSESGCEDGVVVIRRAPEALRCPYERGAVIEGVFGGRTGTVCTPDPVQASTRISFMFGAAMDTPGKRSAALAILNTVTAFFCLSRKVHACPVECREACLRDLIAELRGKRVFRAGTIPVLDGTSGFTPAENRGNADVILVHAAHLIGGEPGETGSLEGATGRLLFLGPTPAGVAALLNRPQWCPYGS